MGPKSLTIRPMPWKSVFRAIGTTGTPARVDRRSVALDQLEEQPSDAADRFFSFDPAAWVSGEQMSCHITRTTAATHQLIRDNLHLTPIYGIAWLLFELVEGDAAGLPGLGCRS